MQEGHGKTIVEVLQILEPGTMQHHKSVMLSLTDRPGSGPRGSSDTDQVRLSLFFQSLAEIVYCAENLCEPIQHGHLPMVLLVRLTY